MRADTTARSSNGRSAGIVSGASQGPSPTARRTGWPSGTLAYTTTSSPACTPSTCVG